MFSTSQAWSIVPSVGLPWACVSFPFLASLFCTSDISYCNLRMWSYLSTLLPCSKFREYTFTEKYPKAFWFVSLGAPLKVCWTIKLCFSISNGSKYNHFRNLRTFNYPLNTYGTFFYKLYHSVSYWHNLPGSQYDKNHHCGFYIPSFNWLPGLQDLQGLAHGDIKHSSTLSRPTPCRAVRFYPSTS